LASRRTHYTRANPDSNPALVFNNPNLISRKSKKEESSASHTTLIKANSCPDEWLFLEDLPFDEQFDFSLFKLKSESEIYDIILDHDFIADLEVQKANQSIDEYIPNSPQSSLSTAKIHEFFEQLFTTFSSPLFPSTFEAHPPPPFIPLLPHQHIVSHSPPTSPGSSSILHPHSNPSQPTAMANRYAPLVLPAPLGAMPADYQSKIVQFDGTGHYTAQHHVNNMTDYFQLHEIDIVDVQMRRFP